MKKLLLIFIMMATWMVVGCETVRQAGGLIEITLDLIDNVWRMKLHTQIQRRGHTDENDITNFGNVIFE